MAWSRITAAAVAALAINSANAGLCRPLSTFTALDATSSTARDASSATISTGLAATSSTAATSTIGDASSATTLEVVSSSASTLADTTTTTTTTTAADETTTTASTTSTVPAGWTTICGVAGDCGDNGAACLLDWKTSLQPVESCQAGCLANPEACKAFVYATHTQNCYYIGTALSESGFIEVQGGLFVFWERDCPAIRTSEVP